MAEEKIANGIYLCRIYIAGDYGYTPSCHELRVCTYSRGQWFVNGGLGRYQNSYSIKEYYPIDLKKFGELGDIPGS